jgi:mRNA-degrading endonuclease RelE of RelBE toxin-antitoxin system
MTEELKIEVNGTYKTHVGELVKILDIDEPNDRIHIYNISESASQWVSYSRAKKFKFRTRIN